MLILAVLFILAVVISIPAYTVKRRRANTRRPARSTCRFSETISPHRFLT